MLDKSVPYYELNMKRNASVEIPQFDFPKGYAIVPYKEGDEQHWAAIEQAVGEFDTISDALLYFQQEFSPYENILPTRMFFIQNDVGEKVGTATAWSFGIDGKGYPRLHWVAIKPAYQGKGLSKPLLTYVMQQMVAIFGDVDFYLDTQTWSHIAIQLYRKFGYEIMKEPFGKVQDIDKIAAAIAVLENLGYTNI